MRPAAALTVLSCLLFAAGCGGSDDGANATDSAGGSTLEELWRAPGDDVAVIPGTANHEPGDVRVSRVRHDPGVHTSWHVHRGGQVIYVESGRGLVQKWGGEIQEMRAGDIVYTAPGEKHWHGAAPGSSLTIVATSIGETEWLERVQPPNGKLP